MSRPCVLLAGGGTGGHVFPAIAVAEALLSLSDVEPVFCGTARGVEARVVPARGFRLELLDVEPMKGGGIARALRGAVVAALATGRALRLVRRLRPRAVLSVGGYASGPVTLAAALLGVPIAVMEPNSVVGLANRIVAPLAKRAYLAWPEAAGTFRPETQRTFGVPLRPGFSPRAAAAREVRRVLVLGGSQGAAALNERVPQAWARLVATPGMPPFEVVHQAGRDRDASVRAAYAALDPSAPGVTVTPFVDDVAQELAASDVVISRAGAGALAEITAVGRASLLVPFPHAADDHQTRNARALARAGGAVLLPQSEADPARLATELGKLLVDDALRLRMAERSREQGKPGAALDVAADLLALAGIAARPRETDGAPGRRPGAPFSHEVR